MAATRATISLAVLAIVAACSEPLESGLSVDEVDATFGLARRDDKGDTDSAQSATDIGATTRAGEQDGASSTSEQDGASGELGAAATDAGPPLRSCRSVASFTEKVTPLLMERCVRCHDGTKAKATKTLDLTGARDPSPAAQQAACEQMLRSAPDSSEQSPIFAEVNPADTMTVHDFKYPSSMAYMTYRSTVLAWLEGE